MGYSININRNLYFLLNGTKENKTWRWYLYLPLNKKMFSITMHAIAVMHSTFKNIRIVTSIYVHPLFMFYKQYAVSYFINKDTTWTRMIIKYIYDECHAIAYYVSLNLKRNNAFPIINLFFVTVNNCERSIFFIYRTKPAVWVTNNYKRTYTCTSGNSFSGTGFSSEDNVAIFMR